MGFMGPNNPGLFGKIAQLIQDYLGFMNPNNPRLFGLFSQLIQDYLGWNNIFNFAINFNFAKLKFIIIKK